MGQTDEKDMREEEADTGKRYEGREEDFAFCCHLLGDLLLPLLSDLGLLLFYTAETFALTNSPTHFTEKDLCL
jgi:hypothetical protein